MREGGFYWVKRAGFFEVGAWCLGSWSLAASNSDFDDDDFELIGEQIPEPKGLEL